MTEWSKELNFNCVEPIHAYWNNCWTSAPSGIIILASVAFGLSTKLRMASGTYTEILSYQCYYKLNQMILK